MADKRTESLSRESSDGRPTRTDISAVLFEMGLPADNIASWWERPNPFLTRATPTSVFDADPDAVMGAAQALADGAYA